MRDVIAICMILYSASVSGKTIETSKQASPQIEASKSHAESASTKRIHVDCTKGERIQDAIDRNGPGVVVDVHGICAEDVRIEGKAISLRGSNPATDGVQGVSNEGAAVTLLFVAGVKLENLSMSNGPGFGVMFTNAQGSMSNCRIVGNARTGIHVTAGSRVTANAVTSNDNRNGALAEQSGLFECVGCTMTGNTFFAARARFAGTVSLGNCLIAGSNGLLGEYDGYAEAYCESSPCSLNVNGAAIWGSQRGSAAIVSIGDFAGQIRADANGEIQVVGSRQISTAGVNEIDSFSTLSVDAGRLSAPLTVSRFGRVTITGPSVVAGRIDCSGAGDVWLSPSVSVNPDVSITGCAHASAP